MIFYDFFMVFMIFVWNFDVLVGSEEGEGAECVG